MQSAEDLLVTASFFESLTDLLRRWGLADVPAWSIRLALLSIAFVLAYIAHQITRRFLVKGVRRLALKTRTHWDDILVEQGVFGRLAHLVPALVLHFSAALIFPDEGGVGWREVLQRFTVAYMVLAGAVAANAFLTAINRIYESSFEEAAERPIRSYIQVVSIFFWVLASILAVAVLMDRSPWALLGGLGAMTAVLMLVFKDSILGLVASIQLTANDMVRIGDWIEMPQYGADGNVTEILLSTVKVQNWDKTITTIPTYRLISDAFKNWRGMSESGVRRIRRSVLIDMTSVRFVDAEMLARFKKIRYIQSYLDAKLEEIGSWNTDHEVDESSLVNGRRLTNLGTLRAYLVAYFRHHPIVDQDMTLMVHQLAPTEKGLPLQIYVFSKEQRWAHYEAIMADIFDHVLAVIPQFDLRLAQMPTGSDFQAFSASTRDQSPASIP